MKAPLGFRRVGLFAILVQIISRCFSSRRLVDHAIAGRDVRRPVELALVLRSADHKGYSLVWRRTERGLRYGGSQLQYRHLHNLEPTKSIPRTSLIANTASTSLRSM
jgi:hypothetical protein